MIAHWMLYCAAVGVLLCAGAAAAERALRSFGRPVRWAWAAAIVLALAIPAAARWLPRALPQPLPAPALALDAAAPAAALPELSSAAAPAPRRIDLAGLDRPLVLLWAASTAAAVLALLAAWAVLERRRRRWSAAEVDGVPVLLSPRTGPAVVGLFRSRIVLPEWVVCDAEPRVRALLLEHEREHLRAGDPRLLALGLAAAALMPWNPAAWWQLRRLRLAVEMDCDARVLARRGDVRTYGALLLEVGRRASSADRMITAAAFSEPASFLERRIRMMTLPRARRPLLRAAAFGGAAALLVAAACRAPGPARPAPTEPAPAGDTPREDAQPAAAVAGRVDTGVVPARAASASTEAVIAPPAAIAGTAGTTAVTTIVSTRAVEAVVTPAHAVAGRTETVAVSATATTRPADAVIVTGTASMRPVDAVIISTTPSTRPAGAIVAPATATTRPAGAVVAPATAATRPVDHVVPAHAAPRRDTVPVSVANPEVVSAALRQEYPALLRDAGIEGTAVLELRVAANGTLSGTRIVESSHPAFGQAAVRAIAAARFRPARHRGTAVATTTLIPLQFRLDRGSTPPLTSARAGRNGATTAAAAVAGRAWDQPPVPTNPDEIARGLRAAYPPLLRAAGLAADAQVRVRVAATGEVLAAQAVEASHPEAGAAAARVLGGARFRPARKDGRAVAAEVTVPVQFRLDAGERP
jgi:TonB family protein